jgi:aryl sulfotransferase
MIRYYRQLVFKIKMCKKNIIWLASYPKSGNTWFRAFLTNLFSGDTGPADINRLIPSTIASSRELFEETSGIPSSDLLLNEVEHTRPLVYEQIAAESENPVYFKIHDAYTFLSDGSPLIPASATKAVLYIIRNPLDIAVSFAHHMSASIDKTISIMNDTEYSFCNFNDRLGSQIRQVILSWSRHVISWVDESGLPLLVIRYEDMISNALDTFTRAVLFLGLNEPEERILIAIKNSSFEILKEQEIQKGFNEKNIKTRSFFRKGQADEWKSVLTQDQADRIRKAHGTIMKRFDYEA